MTEIIPLAKKGEEKHKHERSKKMKIQKYERMEINRSDGFNIIGNEEPEVREVRGREKTGYELTDFTDIFKMSPKKAPRFNSHQKVFHVKGLSNSFFISHFKANQRKSKCQTFFSMSNKPLGFGTVPRTFLYLHRKEQTKAGKPKGSLPRAAPQPPLFREPRWELHPGQQCWTYTRRDAEGLRGSPHSVSSDCSKPQYIN
ncbi:hypothetical protein Anapl_05830 [Anas platyrhynchos]|uniref:Uncharacterized protein n=1 Tax=Anas platyrhynchos TaxID=8839 RepID=R0JST2_ANAPL|nr:hypothetical protein Anapl_05830 [Anas platyrhynchos]